MRQIEVGKNDSGQRIDRFLRKYLRNCPLSRIYKFLRKDIKVNSKRVEASYLLCEGDIIRLYVSDEEYEMLVDSRKTENLYNKKSSIQIEPAYEDENILVANKPKGILTHGDRFEKKKHLTNQVIDYLIQKGEYNPRTEHVFKPAPANRIDRNTTGLVLFGKNANAIRDLAYMLKKRGYIDKEYLTIVEGELTDVMELVGSGTKNRKSNTMLKTEKDNAKEMETLITPIKSNGEFSLVSANLITGRTHQIRFQLAEAGFPIIGDSKYGNQSTNRFFSRKFALRSQLLHSYKIAFVESYGTLDYLKGEKITAAPPKEFSIIEKYLFGEGEQSD